MGSESVAGHPTVAKFSMKREWLATILERFMVAFASNNSEWYPLTVLLPV